MKYAIWNKQDDVLSPSGKVFTAEQWKEKFPIAKLDRITVVCSAGEINGAFFGTLGQMVSDAEEKGVDFSACSTDEEKLALIEAFEKSQLEQDKEAFASSQELAATALASIAASLEYQNMMTLEDVEVTE